MTRTQLLDLVLLITGATRPRFAVAIRYFGFSHKTGRQAVHANLGSRDQLTARLVDALHQVAGFTRRDRNRRWTCAIGLHSVPFYGDRGTPGGPKKAGTLFFHAYATCVLLHKHRRYTVGLVTMHKGDKPHQQVQALLDQVAARGLTVGGVVLDAGFDSGETLLLLQHRDLCYTVRIRKKGKGTNRRNECNTQPSGPLATMDWVTEKSRHPVSARVLISSTCWVTCGARASGAEAEQWDRYVGWMRGCWQGRVSEALVEQEREQERIGEAPDDAEETAPRVVLARARGYCETTPRG